MAEVWEAVDVILSRPVAVKALLPRLASDQAFVTRFRREAVAAARLSHPNIVSIFDTCSQPGCEAIVMELVRGRTLRDAIDEGPGLPMATAVDIAVQVAAALEHAHRHGLVHRDVKPANILLGGDGRVLVADFGIAKALRAGGPDDAPAPDPGPGAGPGDPTSVRRTAGAGPDETTRRPVDAELHHLDLTAFGDVMGTAKYLAPEQVEGAVVDARADVYALGVVLYEMLCGRPPFVGPDPNATAVARLVDEPLRPRQVRAGIPRQLEEITLRALGRDPASRYPSAGAFKAALGAVDVAPLGSRSDPTATAYGYDLGAAGDADAAYEVGDGYAGPERAWLVPAALILVIAVTLGVVGVLVGRTDVGHGLFESVGVASGHDRVLAATASSFDPHGDGQEDDAQVGAAVDRDPGTAWRTEAYRSAAFGGLKDGVGLVLRLQGATDLDRLVLDSPTRRWAGRVYVGDGRAGDLAGWGQPVGTVTADRTAGGAPVTVDLHGRKASAVLVWVTDLGVGPAGELRFELREATLRG
jgi:serine/threonine-protein kinase